MEVLAFLESCTGKWFSQRTRYDFDQNNAENQKSELNMEKINPGDAELQSLCQAYQIKSTQTLGGIKTSWETIGDWGATKQKGSTLWLFSPDDEVGLTGKLFRSVAKPGSLMLSGRYLLAADESLTLILESDTVYTEERLWFASANLRLRTSLIQQRDRFSYSAFYSEIRKLPAPPPPEA